MVTRNIEKNTASQVNADKIGVLVHPDVTPGYDVVNSIIADYSFQYVEVTSSGTDRTVITTENGFSYYATGEQVQSPGNHLWVWEAYGYDPSTPPTYTRLGTAEADYESVNVGSWLFTLDTDEHIDTVASKSTEPGGVSGNFMIIDSSNHCSNPQYGGGYYISGSDFLDSNGNVVGTVDQTVSVTRSDMTFDKVGQSGDNWQWTGSDTDFGQVSLYTVAENPQIGDTAYFNVEDPTFNPQTVKNVVVEHFPPVPDPVECVVSYSVDGETFTVHPTTLTDDNNVICNIPRYVYLKFSQDVTITEE